MACKYTSVYERAIKIVKPAVDKINSTSKYLVASFIKFAPEKGRDHFMIEVNVYVKNQVGRVQNVKKNFGWVVKFFVSNKKVLVIEIGTLQKDYYPSRLAIFDFADEDYFIREVDRVMNSFTENEIFAVDIKRRKVDFSMETPSGRRSTQTLFVDDFV